MRPHVLAAGCGLLFVAGWLLGSSAGHGFGVVAGTRRADWEWARFLENDMVGPGSSSRPGTTEHLTTLRLSGGN